MNEKISVILATKNEEKNVANCIESIKNQTYKNVEIVLVDHGSTDRTVEIAKNLIDKVYKLGECADLAGIKNFRGMQVNYGVSQSEGEIIFFPDADMTFSPNLFEDIIKCMFLYDALYVPETIVRSDLFGKIRNFERSFYNETPIDAIRVVKKCIFDKIGGFDVKNIVFGPDDWDLTKSIKKETFKVGITSEILFHNESKMSLKKYFKKKGDYVYSFEDYRKKWGDNDLDIKKQFGICYRYFGVFVENGKWINVLRKPHLFILLILSKIIIGCIYLAKRTS